MTERKRPVGINDINKIIEEMMFKEPTKLWMPPDTEYSEYQVLSDGHLYFGNAINTTCIEVTEPIGELPSGEKNLEA